MFCPMSDVNCTTVWRNKYIGKQIYKYSDNNKHRDSTALTDAQREISTV